MMLAFSHIIDRFRFKLNAFGWGDAGRCFHPEERRYGGKPSFENSVLASVKQLSNFCVAEKWATGQIVRRSAKSLSKTIAGSNIELVGDSFRELPSR